MTSSDLEIDIDAITTRAIDSFAQAATSEDLKEAEREFLGKASNLAFLSASISKRPIAERSNVGKLVGDARQAIQRALERRRTEVTSAEVRERLQREYLDVTALPARARLGARHPLSLLQDHVSDLFVGMGWEVAEGPELEHAWFNFDALNTDIDHPARTSQDTFYTDPIGDNLVLRSQTSAVQVRALLERELPVFIVTPGRVFRRDEYDATHLPVFHQIEGLAVAEGLSMAHLKGTLEYFARQMFGDSARIRFRANFFPFTEPSAELDVWHDEFIGGARWIEWGGCGMINANVLRAAGVDPEKYSGFAFGMGLERTLMFRNAVADMRAFAEGDVRFSGQFGFRI